jgi:hypothetical protein
VTVNCSVDPAVHPAAVKSNSPCRNTTPGGAVGGTRPEPGGAGRNCAVE